MRTTILITCFALACIYSTAIHAQGWGLPGDCDHPLIDCWDGQNPGSSANSTAKDYYNGGTGYVMGCMAYYLIYGICNCEDFCGEDGDGDGDDDLEPNPDPGEGDPDEGGTDPDPDQDDDEEEDADTEYLQTNSRESNIILKELDLERRKRNVYFTKASKSELYQLRKRLYNKRKGAEIAKIRLADGTLIVSKLVMKAEYDPRDPSEFITAVIVTQYNRSGKRLIQFGVTSRATIEGISSLYRIR